MHVTRVSRHRELIRYRRPILTHPGPRGSGRVAIQDANQEVGAIFAEPLFAGPLSFEGRPTRAWFDALQPTPESPRVASPEALDTLALPPSLRELLDTYLTGAGDPWYAAIRSARGGQG